MPRNGGFGAPVGFTVAMVVLCELIYAVGDLEIRGHVFWPPLILVPIFRVISIVSGAVVVLILARACRGEATFESSFRITAYAGAVLPLAGVTRVLPHAFIFSILLAAYSCYLATVGVTTFIASPRRALGLCSGD
jgi:hypothetical protein